MDDFQAHLKKLDISLACGICSDVFDTPLLLRTCGHSFCAACIRQNIEFQEKNGNTAYCPTCRMSCDARDLIGNVVLRGVVEKYLNLLQWCKEQKDTQHHQKKDTRHQANDRGKHTVDEMYVISDNDEDEDVSGDACSSGEEYDPVQDHSSRVLKQQKRQKPSPPTGPTIGTSSFVECPVCGKNIHHLHMNGHIDACLNSNPRVGEGEKPAWTPLEVPSKIIGTLANDKTIKAALRKYGIPCEGKKSELIDRYNRFRTEVEIANDKQETTTYERIVFRIAKQETYKAAASLFKSRTNDTTMMELTIKKKPLKEQHGGVIDMTIQSPQAKHPSEIVLPDDPSYADLIRITKRRDRLRRRLLSDANKNDSAGVEN